MCECGAALNTSVYIVIAGELRKSCSYCSKATGQHVFHPLAAFGMWHYYTDKDPSPQSECVAAYRARVGDSRGDFEPAGDLCRELGERPRRARDPTIAELLEPLRVEAEEALAADHPAGRRVSCDGPSENRGAPRPRREPEPKLEGPDRLAFNPARPPSIYDWGDRYDVGDRILHPAFGTCVVTRADRELVEVECADRRRALSHGRAIALQSDLVELVRDYGEPLSVEEVASYCGIPAKDATRQLNALVRRGDAARAGDRYVCNRKEYRAA